MKKIIFFTIFLISATNEFAFANSKDCNELKKLSLEYFKCKGKIVKDKTISAKATEQILTEPLIMMENEILKVQATQANELFAIASILEMNRDDN